MSITTPNNEYIKAKITLCIQYCATNEYKYTESNENGNGNGNGHSDIEIDPTQHNPIQRKQNPIDQIFYTFDQTNRICNYERSEYVSNKTSGTKPREVIPSKAKQAEPNLEN